MWPDLDLATTEGAPDGAEDSALVVGIGDYLLAPDVPGADTNARDWWTYLTEVRKVPVDRAFLLLDGEANDARIRARAEEVAKLGTGRVWFVFVGHGAPGPAGESLLVGADAAADAETLAARSVDRDALLATLASGGRPVTAIVDACFSGKDATGAPLVPGLQPLVPSWVARPLPPAVTLATAAGPDQFAGPLPGADRPAFSYLVLGAATGWGDRDGDGGVTLAEAVDFATVQLVTQVTTRRQTPSLTGPGDLALGAGRQDLGGPPKAVRPPRPPRRGHKDWPLWVGSGALLAGAGAFGVISGTSVSRMRDAEPNPVALTNDWSAARNEGIAAWSLLGASALTAGVALAW